MGRVSSLEIALYVALAFSFRLQLASGWRVAQTRKKARGKRIRKFPFLRLCSIPNVWKPGTDFFACNYNCSRVPCNENLIDCFRLLNTATITTRLIISWFPLTLLHLSMREIVAQICSLATQRSTFVDQQILMTPVQHLHAVNQWRVYLNMLKVEKGHPWTWGKLLHGIEARVTVCCAANVER